VLTRAEICVVSFFEDYLKTAYAAFVQILAAAGHNTVVFIKNRALKKAYELLCAKPEQEKALLSLLINKLGDSSSKVSSNVSFCIKELLKKHPGMKSPVVKEAEAFLARPNITTTSKYFALLLLSEISLSQTDGVVASRLVRLFVAQLEVALKKPKLSKKEFRRRKRGLAPKKKNLQPLREEDNRLVRTLINGIRRAMPYVDAIGGAALTDDTVNSLFKVCHTVNAFSTRVSILGLLYRGLASGDPPDRFYRLLYEQLGHFDFFTSSHSWQAFMLLQKCVPADASCARGVAMARRLLQLGVGTEPMVTIASLGVMRDLFAVRRIEMLPLMHTVDRKVVPAEEEGNAAEEEHFVDDDVAEATAKNAPKETHYDPLWREPRFARARNAPFWELQALSSHVHPSVSHYAQKLMRAEAYQDAPANPFDIFSVSELLEQFAYHSRVKRERRSGKKLDEKAATMNSQTFLKRKNVQPHERFFKSYFTDPTIAKEQERKRKATKKNLEDVDEEQDGEDSDEFFDEYLKGQMPDAEEDDDDDDEDDMDDDDDDLDDDGDDGGDVCAEEGEQEPGTSDESEAGVFCDGDVDEEEVVNGAKGKKDKRSRVEKAKELKKKRKGSGSMFASIDDFQQLLDADGYS